MNIILTIISLASHAQNQFLIDENRDSATFVFDQSTIVFNNCRMIKTYLMDSTVSIDVKSKSIVLSQSRKMKRYKDSARDSFAEQVKIFIDYSTGFIALGDDSLNLIQLASKENYKDTINIFNNSLRAYVNSYAGYKEVTILMDYDVALRWYFWNDIFFTQIHVVYRKEEDKTATLLNFNKKGSLESFGSFSKPKILPSSPDTYHSYWTRGFSWVKYRRCRWSLTLHLDEDTEYWLNMRRLKVKYDPDDIINFLNTN